MESILKYSKSSLEKLGDLANELGDVLLAIKCYLSVLNKVGTFDEAFLKNKKNIDRVKRKIENLDVQKSNLLPILYPANWKLSKSSFVKGSQCMKYLYLDTHKREEKTLPNKETQLLFEKGHHFEDLFREKMFPGGVNVKSSVGITAYYASYTKYLLSQINVEIIYEATFIEDDVLVMCDVLSKRENGLIDVYECKMSLKINDAIKNDLAVQYAVCKKRFGKKLRSFNLVLAKEEGGWTITDMTADLSNQFFGTQKSIEKYKKVLSDNEPEIPMGNHCKKPYKCEFVEYCLKNKN